MTTELVTFTNARGLDLDGVLYSSPSSALTIIHVHGSFGNFYQSRFLRVLAEAYGAAGVNLLAFNTSGHDGCAEGYRNRNQFEYVGGALADFAECVADLDGAIAFAGRLGKRIILQGHSLGCDRVMHFLATRQVGLDFVLLAPCDSYQLQCNWIAPETVEEQIARLATDEPADPVFDWLSSREYGVRQPNGWTYAIPITRRAFLSIANGPPFRLVNIRNPFQFALTGRALIYLGGQDALQTWPADTMFQYFRERVQSITEVHVPHGDHMLTGCEETVAERIIKWLGR